MKENANFTMHQRSKSNLEANGLDGAKRGLCNVISSFAKGDQGAGVIVRVKIDPPTPQLSCPLFLVSREILSTCDDFDGHSSAALQVRIPYRGKFDRDTSAPSTRLGDASLATESARRLSDASSCES